MQEENIIIGDKPAVKFTYNMVSRGVESFEPGRFMQVIDIPLSEKMLFRIVANTDLPERETYEPILNQMLSTFRFLE